MRFPDPGFKAPATTPGPFRRLVIGLTLPADFRVHYWGSIHSSYRLSELEQIVQRSSLQNWEIIEDFFDLAVKS